MKMNRKIISLLLSVSLLACMVIPASATEIAEENRTTAPANRVLEAIETQLLNYYECMDLFAYEERSFSDLSVGEGIYAYEYQDGSFNLLDFVLYPVFSDNDLAMLISVREAVGRTVAQIIPSFDCSLNGVQEEIAIVYDSSTCYAYSLHYGFVALYDYAEIHERDTWMVDAEVNEEAIQTSAALINGGNRYRLEFEAEISTLANHAVLSLPVGTVLQGNYSNLCRAAAVSCIGNYRTNYYNMKAKLLRRVLCVALCVAVLVCSCVNALGAELFSEIYPLKWDNSSAGSLTFYWYDHNCYLQNTSISTCFDTAYAYWQSTNLVTIHNSRSLNTDAGCIANAVPMTTWWESYWMGSDYVYNAAAVTLVYDTTYTDITEANCPFSTGRIKGANNIYYNPMENAHYGYSNLNYICLIAHEAGHALGFGHYEGGQSIMNSGLKTFSSLQTYDVSCINAKYG